jgi:hypothetical protein
LVNQLKLGLGSKVVHGANPTHDFSKAQGLRCLGAWNTVVITSQTFAKGILYLGNNVSWWNQTPFQNFLLAVFDHVPEVSSMDGFSSDGTIDPPALWGNISFTSVTKLQCLTH